MLMQYDVNFCMLQYKFNTLYYGLLRITFLQLKSDGLACCNTDSREWAVLFEVSAAEVDAEVLLLLSISPRSLSGVDLDIPEHEAGDVILIVSSLLSCSSLDSSLVLILKLPLHFFTSATIIKLIKTIIKALLDGVCHYNHADDLIHFLQTFD